MVITKEPLPTQDRSEERSLSEVNRSIAVPASAAGFRRFLLFAGPGYMVSVGYMDPGNWATDLAGGSKFGYALIWVILASNLMAQFLQSLCAKLGLVTQKDLAQACRDYYKKPAAIALWILCEIAIIACDLAEVVGSAVALNLLFGIPLQWGVLITAADVLVLLVLMNFGFRKLEAVVVVLVATVAACFALDLFLAKPDWALAAKGTFLPSLPGGVSGEALIISLGILGATVMPHNLYLHSSIVQTREIERTPTGLKQAIRNNIWDTVLALSAAFFVNAAILVLAAAVFSKGGVVVEELQQAHELLKPALGGAAATAFALALLASGQSSTITGTLAGQIVMEGFTKIRIAPWKRRMITRLLAIVPTMIIISATGGKGTVEMLIISQVILSMQLAFAVFPLIMLTSDKVKMGEFANAPWVKWTGYSVGIVIGSLNLFLLYQTFSEKVIGGVYWLGGLASLGIGFALWVMFGYRPKAAPASV